MARQRYKAGETKEKQDNDFYRSEGHYPNYEHEPPKRETYGTLAELHQKILNLESYTGKKVTI